MTRSDKARDNRLFSVLPTHTYGLYAPQDAGRADAELAVRQIFRKVYNADIDDFSSLLITAESQDCDEASIDAVIGLRHAGDEKLFLEHYLDRPIEQQLAQKHDLPLSRQGFIEIGNLVASRPGISRQLFIALAFALAEAGIEWVAFTATRQVSQLLHKLAMQPVVIGCAAEQAVVNGNSNWGSYYADSPSLCIGNVRGAIAVLQQNPTIRAIYPLIQSQVSQLATQIKRGFAL